MTRALPVLALLPATALAPVPAGGLGPDEQVIFFPTVGSRVDADAWELTVHGWVFEPEKRRTPVAAFQAALGLDACEMTGAERDLVAERARAFLVDNERGKRVTIRLGTREFQLGPSGPSGHVVGHLRLGADDLARLRGADADRLPFRAVLAPGDARTFGGVVHLAGETGWSVVSDVDDTIKISQVRDRQALVRHTFCRPFEPVPGMAAVYRAWAGAAGARFHYVSASPWPLYPALSAFARSTGLPDGTWHLKPFRWKDESLLELFAKPDVYKASVIEPLLARFPRRRFVLVGDSGERDPEIFGALARRHPGQIARVLIRDVTGEAPAAPRYRAAFRDLAPGVGQVFGDPAEIAGAVGQIGP
ncbi:MAG TPA: App1 family protein [Acidimicrobiales bacterium]